MIYKNRPWVFISMPYRGTYHIDILNNVREAERVASKIWMNGMAALCPHLNSFMFSGACEEEAFLESYLDIIPKMDLFLLLGKWNKSPGCIRERKEAELLKIPVFESLETLIDYNRRMQDAKSRLLYNS